MTLKEAKNILKKEFAVIGLHKSTEPFEFDDSNWFGYEKPAVLEAFRVLAKEGYYVTISGHDYDMRKKRLQKEYEQNTKAPGSAENRIKEDSGVNPALKESASQFNDALLDEQAKKIVELTEENERLKDQVAVLYANKENNEKYNLKQIKRLGKEIARLNKIIHKKSLKIEELKEESSERLDGKVKYYGETVDLTQELFYKNEELRLSKIRERNLTEVGQKYMKENEELRKKLADKVVDEINAKALKSAESALAYKEKVIAEKDEVIADLGKELAAQKGLKDEISLKYIGVKRILKLRRDECEKLKKELDAFKESYKRRIKEDSEHFEHIQKICNAGLQKWLIESEYLEKDKPFRFPQLPDFNEEEEKKHSLFRDDSVGAVTNQKDCSPVKDTHPTVDIAEEGGDHSAIIARCCKNIAISKDEAEIIERCTKNGTELHYSEKDGFTYTNMFGDEMPIICLRGMCQVFTDEEIKNMKK